MSQQPALLIKERFRIDPDATLGEGAFGKVCKGFDHEGLREIAVKMIDTAHFPIENIEHEVCVMRSLENAHIIEVIDYHHDKDAGTAFVFLELIDGVELFDRVTGNDEPAGHLSEAASRPIFRELARAVAYCHAQGIAHRDLKLDNVLISKQGALKLIDFGLAARIDARKCGKDGSWDDSGWKDVCGTRCYAAPEVLAGGSGYGCFSADVWSLGVCLFAMCAGFFPLDEATRRDWRFARLKFLVRSGQSASHAIFEFYGKSCPWSPELVELVNSMLVPEPKQRPKMAQILTSKWLTSEADADMLSDAPTETSYMSRVITDAHGGWLPPHSLEDDDGSDMDATSDVDDDVEDVDDGGEPRPKYQRPIRAGLADSDNAMSEVPVFRGAGLTHKKAAPALRRIKAFQFHGQTLSETTM